MFLVPGRPDTCIKCGGSLQRRIVKIRPNASGLQLQRRFLKRRRSRYPSTMANTTISQGLCTAPFLQLSNFPSNRGCGSQTGCSNELYLQDADTSGRFCAPVPTTQGIIDCCLPCPLTDWVYGDGTPTCYGVHWKNETDGVAQTSRRYHGLQTG